MPDAAPATVDLPLASLIALCVEHWRLSTWLAPLPSAGCAPARHALRRIGDILKQYEIEARSLDGKPFDHGLAVRVVDAVEDDSLEPGQVVIGETLSPLVLWKGAVVKPADVVTRQRPAEGS